MSILDVDFRGFSYGFRPGRSPHRALDVLAVGIGRKRVNWVLDADIRDFFGQLDLDNVALTHRQPFYEAGWQNGDNARPFTGAAIQARSATPPLAQPRQRKLRSDRFLWNHDHMTKPAEMIATASAALGGNEEVLAAGIFGLQDNYAALAVAGVATGVAMDLAAVPENPAADALKAAVTAHVTRTIIAESKGMSVRMLVAVTPHQIHVWKWSLAGIGDKITDFNRELTVIQITKFGLSRHLNLLDSTKTNPLQLTGTTAFFSSESAGDKSVLELLSRDN